MEACGVSKKKATPPLLRQIEKKGPRTLVRFLRDSRAHGYGQALKDAYGCTFAELEEQWREQAFPGD